MTLFAFPFRAALGYGSLADPPGSSVLGAAVSWLGGTLLGTVATSVAIIAVAAVGIAMLGGRIDARRGLTVVLGSFLLFGAATIAAGLRSFAPDAAGPDLGSAPPPVPVPAPAAAPPASAPDAGYDPYAGASVRTQ